MGQVDRLNRPVIIEDHAVRINLPRRASLAEFEIDENEIVRAGKLKDIPMAGADNPRLRITIGDNVVRRGSCQRDLADRLVLIM